jgi:catechol 2,3-dioxygenase-like lactoylglutathione lyase family enzyme
MRGRNASNPEPAVIAIFARGLRSLSDRQEDVRRTRNRQLKFQQPFDDASAMTVRFLTAPIEIWRSRELSLKGGKYSFRAKNSILSFQDGWRRYGARINRVVSNTIPHRDVTKTLCTCMALFCSPIPTTGVLEQCCTCTATHHHPLTRDFGLCFRVFSLLGVATEEHLQICRVARRKGMLMRRLSAPPIARFAISLGVTIFVVSFVTSCEAQRSALKTRAEQSTPQPFVRIDHAGLNVSNLSVSAAFYEDVFGFEIVHQWKTTWMVGSGTIRLGLFERPKAARLADVDPYLIPQHVAFLVSEAGFKAYLERLEKLGIKHEDDDSGIAKSAFVKDPDNISIEVIYYYKEAPPLG